MLHWSNLFLKIFTDDNSTVPSGHLQWNCWIAFCCIFIISYPFCSSLPKVWCVFKLEVRVKVLCANVHVRICKHVLFFDSQSCFSCRSEGLPNATTSKISLSTTLKSHWYNVFRDRFWWVYKCDCIQREFDPNINCSFEMGLTSVKFTACRLKVVYEHSVKEHSLCSYMWKNLENKKLPRKNKIKQRWQMLPGDARDEKLCPGTLRGFDCRKLCCSFNLSSVHCLFWKDHLLLLFEPTSFGQWTSSEVQESNGTVLVLFLFQERIQDSPSPAPSLEDSQRPGSHASSHQSSSVSSSPSQLDNTPDRIG